MPADIARNPLPATPIQPTPIRRGSVGEVLRVFLRLGLTSFGGPLAHVGYFRLEFVSRRDWLDEHRFSQLLAICQLLPGPASSQLGFAIGLLRAGFAGALAAFVAFTLPSALLLFALALLAPRLQSPWGMAVLHGLKLVAVVVVAQALIGMARQLTPDARRILIAIGAAASMLWVAQAWMQVLVIALAALAGWLLCRQASVPAAPDVPLGYGRRAAGLCLLLFLVLLGAAFLCASDTPSLSSLAAAFYLAGALVFGGGHVVLPMLKTSVVDTAWISADDFLAGYGAAQAMPGPLFSLAAFLGADVGTGHASWISALVAIAAVFLPGFLLLIAALPWWRQLTGLRGAAAALAGVNAGVVGLLAAAFCNPVWRDSVQSVPDVFIVASGFLLLHWLRLSPLWVVLICTIGALACRVLAI